MLSAWQCTPRLDGKCGAHPLDFRNGVTSVGLGPLATSARSHRVAAKWSPGQVEARFANMPSCLIGMEACVGAHHLSRKLNALDPLAPKKPAGEPLLILLKLIQQCLFNIGRHQETANDFRPKLDRRR